MIRTLFVIGLMGLAACRVPYTADLADMTVLSEDLPPTGTSAADLGSWFQTNGYAAGPRVHQTVAELLRRPGDPLVYARQQDKQWWLSQQRNVRDVCVTQRVIYYRLAPNGTLAQAIPNHRSQC